MRKQFLILCSLVLVGCLVLLLTSRHTKKPELPRPMKAMINPSNQGGTPKSLQNSVKIDHQSVRVPPVQATTNIIYVETSPGKSNAINAYLLSQWQAPIEFYGKVVDENSNPVADANIHFSWQEIPAEDAMRTLDTKSDSDGLFSLQHARGWTLDVSVGKAGYYTSQRDNSSFRYGSLGGGKFHPDSRNPVIFHLLKKGAGVSLIQKDFPPGMGQIWQLHHDGTPIELDLLNGSQNVNGSGQLKLELWRDLSNPNAKQFDWKLQISTLGGGLIPTDEEFAFQAPKNGYQPSIVINMPATNQDWLGELRTKYYIHLPNGDYGRIDLYFLPYNGVFTVHSAINPTGSRNLEPK
jgi:hypothetical protein